MTTPELGKLERVPVREIWPDEERDFTPWLEKNLDILGDELKLELIPVTTEAKANGRRVDILAEDPARGTVIIENQLERSDDGHLSRLFIYAAGHDAHVLIWVAPEFGAEHRATLDWFNRWMADDVQIYGVEIVAWRIGDSLPAVDFNPVVVPNTWSNQAKRVQDRSPSKAINQAYTAFYQPLVLQLRQEEQFGNLGRSSWRTKWRSFPTGYDGIVYGLEVGNDDNPGAHAFLQIETENRQVIFDALSKRKEQIDGKMPGLSVKWDTYTNCLNIGVSMDSSVKVSASNPSSHDATREWMRKSIVNLRDAVQPLLDEVMEELESLESDDGADEGP